MINYEFTEEGIDRMYETTIDEALYLASAHRHDEIPKIVDTIGQHRIEVPNNADFIEMLFGMLADMEADQS